MCISVAVDGGGSQCRLAAFSANGEILGRVSIDEHASLALGVDAAWSHIAQGLEAMREQLGYALGWQPDKLVLGLAGSLLAMRRESLMSLVPDGVTCQIFTDGHAQLLGASGGEPAVCLAIGTGSVIHWMDEQGAVGKAGGWGYPVGDEGSGAWLGLRLMQYCVWDHDGRRQNSLLIPAVQERIGNTVSEIQEWTTESRSTVMASLAPLIFECAQRGDALAQSLIMEAVEQSLSLISFAPERLPLYVVGGVGKRLVPEIEKRLASRVSTVRGDALNGLWLLSQDCR